MGRAFNPNGGYKTYAALANEVYEVVKSFAEDIDGVIPFAIQTEKQGNDLMRITLIAHGNPDNRFALVAINIERDEYGETDRYIASTVAKIDTADPLLSGKAAGLVYTATAFAYMINQALDNTAPCLAELTRWYESINEVKPLIREEWATQIALSDNVTHPTLIRAIKHMLTIGDTLKASESITLTAYNNKDFVRFRCKNAEEAAEIRRYCEDPQRLFDCRDMLDANEPDTTVHIRLIRTNIRLDHFGNAVSNVVDAIDDGNIKKYLRPHQ